jgi:hypothetical protein
MGKIRFRISIVAILTLAVSVGEIKAQGITAESIQVVRIMERDERAVITTPGGNMQLIKVGDLIGQSDLRVPGSGLRVIEIAEGRIVFEENTDKGLETVIVRFEDERGGSELRAPGSALKKQGIERIRKVGDKQAPLYAPK